MSKAKLLLAQLVTSRPMRPQHPWHEYAELIRDCEGIVGASGDSIKVQLIDGCRDIEFAGGLSEEHYQYFAPLLDDWGKTLLARAVCRNMVRCQSFAEEQAAWEPLWRMHGVDDEEWLPPLIDTQGFLEIAQHMEQAVALARNTSHASSTILQHEDAGLSHSQDYRIVRDRHGTTYTCSAACAILIKVLHQAQKEGIPEMHNDILLDTAHKQLQGNSALAKQIQSIKYRNVRLDHLWARAGLWKTVVTPGRKRGCYRLVV